MKEHERWRRGVEWGLEGRRMRWEEGKNANFNIGDDTVGPQAELVAVRTTVGEDDKETGDAQGGSGGWRGDKNATGRRNERSPSSAGRPVRKLNKRKHMSNTALQK